MVSITDARLLTAAAAAVLAIAFAAPVQAAPLPQDPGCVTLDEGSKTASDLCRADRI
jgi:hypothetical protein